MDGKEKGHFSLLLFLQDTECTHLSIFPFIYQPGANLSSNRSRICWLDQMFISTDVKRGDLLLFNQLCLHKGPANDTLEERLCFFISFGLESELTVDDDYSLFEFAFLDNLIDDSSVANHNPLSNKQKLVPTDADHYVHPLVKQYNASLCLHEEQMNHMRKAAANVACDRAYQHLVRLCRRRNKPPPPRPAWLDEAPSESDEA